MILRFRVADLLWRPVGILVRPVVVDHPRCSSILLMAGYIGWIGAKLVRKASSGLMDEQNVEHDRRVRAILDAHFGPDGQPLRLCSYHNLRHRQNGRYLWVDFHVTIPEQATIKDAHAIASVIEHEIEQSFGEADATSHVENCTNTECPVCAVGRGSCPQ